MMMMMTMTMTMMMTMEPFASSVGTQSCSRFVLQELDHTTVFYRIWIFMIIIIIMIIMINIMIIVIFNHNGYW